MINKYPLFFYIFSICLGNYFNHFEISKLSHYFLVKSLTFIGHSLDIKVDNTELHYMIKISFSILSPV